MAIWRPNFPDFPQIPRLLATRIDKTIFCLVPSIAASQARLSSSSSALDLAIVLCSLVLLQVKLWTLQVSEQTQERRERRRRMGQELRGRVVNINECENSDLTVNGTEIGNPLLKVMFRILILARWRVYSYRSPTRKFTNGQVKEFCFNCLFYVHKFFNQFVLIFFLFDEICLLCF